MPDNPPKQIDYSKIMVFPKRIEGPQTSILIPTRHRAALLRQAIDSLISLAAIKNSMEFILKVDADDPETIATVTDITSKAPCDFKMIVSKQGAGYSQIHNWIGEMAKIASGSWLFVFNDDAMCLTERWDEILYNCAVEDCWHNCPEVFCLVAPVRNRPEVREFLFLRRKVFEILGYYSRNTHADNYVSTVMEMIQSIRMVPIEISHFSDQMTDEIRQKSEETYKTSSVELNNGYCVKERLLAANKLFAYIMENGGERKQ